MEKTKRDVYVAAEDEGWGSDAQSVDENQPNWERAREEAGDREEDEARRR